MSVSSRLCFLLFALALILLSCSSVTKYLSEAGGKCTENKAAGRLDASSCNQTHCPSFLLFFLSKAFALATLLLPRSGIRLCNWKHAISPAWDWGLSLIRPSSLHVSLAGCHWGRGPEEVEEEEKEEAVGGDSSALQLVSSLQRGADRSANVSLSCPRSPGGS